MDAKIHEIGIQKDEDAQRTSPGQKIFKSAQRYWGISGQGSCLVNFYSVLTVQTSEYN
jgi:hypothetical protein